MRKGRRGSEKEDREDRNRKAERRQKMGGGIKGGMEE